MLFSPFPSLFALAGNKEVKVAGVWYDNPLSLLWIVWWERNIIVFENERNLINRITNA